MTGADKPTGNDMARGLGTMTALLRRWRARIGRRHPSRKRLVEAVFDATAPAAISTARHLGRCAPCAQRAGELRTFLDTLADTADDAFDDAFPPDRLRTQRARIDHRLARAVGKIEPARVLAFPFRRARRRPAAPGPGRWAAASTAVGLALGLLTGQLVHLHRNPAPNPGPDAAVARPRAGGATAAAFDRAGAGELRPAPGGEAAPAALTLSEFERVLTETALLDALDASAVSLPVTELASIDALTPRVRDLPPAVR